MFLVGLLAGELWAQCPSHPVPDNGPRIWTAAHRYSGVFKWTTGSIGNVVNRHDIVYMNWSSGWVVNPNEKCINVWMAGDWTWATNGCGSEICFVCENRSAQLICDDC